MGIVTNKRVTVNSNILKSRLDGLTKDFLSGICTDLGLCVRRALETVFRTIVERQLTR